MDPLFISAGFAWVLILGYVGSWSAKGVTIRNGVYTMLNKAASEEAAVLKEVVTFKSV